MRGARVTKLLIIAAILLLTTASNAYAYDEIAKYTAPNGFEVISYSTGWDSEDKLKGIYDELLKNFHGKEMELLSKIYIYPKASTESKDISGQWFGYWYTVKGKNVLMPDRYINLYHGDQINDVKGYARVLAHEYGHHFTYYYYFKNEGLSWDEWRKSKYADIRGIKNNPYIGWNQSVTHAWQIDEIAAEDYVQLFGSPTAKDSITFYDIKQRAELQETNYSFSTDMYNLCPQENLLIGLAGNLKETKKYWLNAVGDKFQSNNYLSEPTELTLLATKDLGIKTNQYIFTWNIDDNSENDIEYTLIRFSFDPIYGPVDIVPIKTVDSGQEPKAIFGAVSFPGGYLWDSIDPEVLFFTVFAKDNVNNIVSSNYLAVDFNYPDDPKFISIAPEELGRGEYFKPRVNLDGKQLQFDVEPVNVNGRIMVPLRKIFEQLGAEVKWDGSARTVSAVKDNINVTLVVEEKKALINGEEYDLDVPSLISEGRTLVPLRFVSESFGAEVKWNQNLQLVTIKNSLQK